MKAVVMEKPKAKKKKPAKPVPSVQGSSHVTIDKTAVPCSDNCQLKELANLLRLKNMELRARETRQLQRIRVLENEVASLQSELKEARLI